MTMGRFDDEFSKQTSESLFNKLQLKELFFSREEQQNLQNVIAALEQAENDNLAKLKIQELGEQGLDVLIKIAKKVLL